MLCVDATRCSGLGLGRLCTVSPVEVSVTEVFQCVQITTSLYFTTLAAWSYLIALRVLWTAAWQWGGGVSPGALSSTGV